MVTFALTSGHEQGHELQSRCVEAFVVSELRPVELVQEAQNPFVAWWKAVIFDP